MPSNEYMSCSCGDVVVRMNISNKHRMNEKMLVFEGIELHVQNLDDEMTEDILKDEFVRFGPILKTKIISSEKSLKRKKYGMVAFLSPADAARAVSYMNGRIIIENTLFVTLASEKLKRRRPSPVPFIQRLNALSLVNGALPVRDTARRKLSLQHLCTQTSWIQDNMTPGGSLIEFKRKLSRSDSQC